MEIQLNHPVTLTFGKDLISFLYIKNDKQLVNNYRPISLLSIFGKIFEKIIFNKMYNFLLDEKLLNRNQSGFRPSDSCINVSHEFNSKM